MDDDPRHNTTMNPRQPMPDIRSPGDYSRTPDSRTYPPRFKNLQGSVFEGSMLTYWDNMLPCPSRWTHRTNARRAAREVDSDIITQAEMDIFYGLTFSMALSPLPNQRQYWETSSTGPFRAPHFGRYMSRNRYELIKRCYTFDAEADRDDVPDQADVPLIPRVKPQCTHVLMPNGSFAEKPRYTHHHDAQANQIPQHRHPKGTSPPPDWHLP
jgi:hypothetical protein